MALCWIELIKAAFQRRKRQRRPLWNYEFIYSSVVALIITIILVFGEKPAVSSDTKVINNDPESTNNTSQPIKINKSITSLGRPRKVFFIHTNQSANLINELITVDSSDADCDFHLIQPDRFTSDHLFDFIYQDMNKTQENVIVTNKANRLISQNSIQKSKTEIGFYFIQTTEFDPLIVKDIIVTNITNKGYVFYDIHEETSKHKFSVLLESLNRCVLR